MKNWICNNKSRKKIFPSSLAKCSFPLFSPLLFCRSCSLRSRLSEKKFRGEVLSGKPLRLKCLFFVVFNYFVFSPSCLHFRREEEFSPCSSEMMWCKAPLCSTVCLFSSSFCGCFSNEGGYLLVKQLFAMLECTHLSITFQWSYSNVLLIPYNSLSENNFKQE